LRVLTGDSPELLLNAVLRFQQPERVTPAAVEAVIAPFRASRRPMQWWVRADTEPAGLSKALQAIGMQPWGAFPGMALPLATWQPMAQPPTIAVQRAATPEDVAMALDIICTVFGMEPTAMQRWSTANPAFTIYLARVAGFPAGAMACLLNAGVAGFFHVATLPRQRRHGVASAMMARALLDLRAQGAHTGALTASPMAHDLYRRLGFIDAGTFTFWMPGPRLMLDLVGEV
jgi:GNAT superfamily N-acetyltransferase